MLPIMLNVENKKCIVIGGGSVALRKAKKLISFGGDVTVISETFCEGFENIKTKIKSYEKDDLNSAFLVIAATNNHDVNLQISKDAKEKNILVSLADDRDVSDFIFPSSQSKGDITVSVSTNGKYPLLSKKICNEIDIDFYSTLLPLLEKYRQELIKKSKDTLILHQLITDEMILIAKNNITEFEKKIKEML